MRILLVVLCTIFLSGCIALTPDGRIDVAKTRRQSENACAYAFLRALPFAGTVVGAWACTFGLDSAFPDEVEPAEPKLPNKRKRKPKPEPAPEPDEED